MKNLFSLKDWREDWGRNQEDISSLYSQRTGKRLPQYKYSRWEKKNHIPTKERRRFFDAFSEDGLALYDIWPELDGLWPELNSLL